MGRLWMRYRNDEDLLRRRLATLLSAWIAI